MKVQRAGSTQGRGHGSSDIQLRAPKLSCERRRRFRHGGGRRRVSLGDRPAAERSAEDVLVLDDALTRLAAEDPAAAELVKLRFYAGFSVEEAADALAISRAQGYRHWNYARAWLRCVLEDELA